MSTETVQGERAETAQRLVVDAVEPGGVSFFHGLLIALAISLVLWGALAALGFGAYVLVTAV